MQNDKFLILKLQNKDEAALAKLYDNYSPAIYGVILRMCKDEQQAQNLLQDTFMTIWEKGHQYDPQKGRFYTWAYRIAKNKTLNFICLIGLLPAEQSEKLAFIYLAALAPFTANLALLSF